MFRFGSKDNNSCYKSGYITNPDGTYREDEDNSFTPEETFIEARTLVDALEHFCSTCTNLELHVGRIVHESLEPETVPKGYNALGEKFDPKPTLEKTKNIPDDKIIQVWIEDEKEPHWFYGVRKGYDGKKLPEDKLIFELPLADVWSYDKWNNVEHPSLPAPDFGNIDRGTDLIDASAFKGKAIRTLSRAEIALARRSLLQKKSELDTMERALSDSISKLSQELEFRGNQLKYLSLYLGRNVEVKLVNKGPKASDSDMVHIRQRVLYMAEEVGAIVSNEVGFDFRNIEDFDRWVCLPENLSIIAPESKCIVFFKPRRSNADYGNPLLNYFLNPENHKVYILMRNGETVYRAHIEIAIPDRLFPEEEKFERELEQRRERSIGTFWESSWEWKTYAEKWKAREKWYKKGFKDSDFKEQIEYKTKEEMLAAKAVA